MNTDGQRHVVGPLDLAQMLFGDPGEEHEAASLAALGKLWSRVPTGRGTTLEVRVGWLAGVRYFQLLERTNDDLAKCTTILVDADALPEIAACMTELVRYEGRR